MNQAGTRKLMKNVWLQDKAVYPLIGFIATALSIATSFGTVKLLSNQDVRIHKSKRMEILRSEPKDFNDSFLPYFIRR